MFIEKVHLMKNHSTKQWDYIWILKFTPQNDNLVYESIWQNAWQTHSRQTPFLKMLEIHNTGIKHKIIFYDEEKKPKWKQWTNTYLLSLSMRKNK